MDMQIELRESNVSVLEPLRDHVERKLGLATRRFEREIATVVVRIVDINGPRGGLDKCCRMIVRFVDARACFVEATDADAYAAVTTAAARLDERISRMASRRRLGRTGRRARAETVRNPREPVAPSFESQRGRRG